MIQVFINILIETSFNASLCSTNLREVFFFKWGIAISTGLQIFCQLAILFSILPGPFRPKLHNPQGTRVVAMVLIRQ